MTFSSELSGPFSSLQQSLTFVLLFSLCFSQASGAGIGAALSAVHFSQLSRIFAEHRTHLYLQGRPSFSSLVAFFYRLFLCRAAYIHFVRHPKEIKLVILYALSLAPLAQHT